MKAREFREKKRGAPAEVTAFFALTFFLLISFAAAVLDGASIQIAKDYRRADMNRAAESVFAEYQRELFEEFDLFGLDMSYETGEGSLEMFKERLAYYGAEDIKQDVKAVRYLSDNEGKAFREQAVKYIEHKYGAGGLKGLLGSTHIWKEQDKASKGYFQEGDAVRKSLDGLFENKEKEQPKTENPLRNIEGLKRGGLLTAVLPRDSPISEKHIETGTLVSKKKKNEGFGSFREKEKEGTESKLALGEYLLDHFYCAAPERDKQIKGGREGGGLDYELEYILSGKGSDRENLEAAAEKLIALRFAPNYGYLLTDGGKKAEAEALALALCTAVAMPQLSEAAAQLILLSWAFGECIMDMRSLLRGGRIPLIKKGEDWQLSLSGLLKLGTEEDAGETAEGGKGLSYKEYLRMLLFLEDEGNLSMRSLDMIEEALRKEEGLSWFQADLCAVKAEIESKCSFRRGITYTFRTYFGYN